MSGDFTAWHFERPDMEIDLRTANPLSQRSWDILQRYLEDVIKADIGEMKADCVPLADDQHFL